MKSALRLLLYIFCSYLLVAFVYTVIHFEPWQDSHAHNMFGGWRGVFMFFVIDPIGDIYDHRDSLTEILVRAIPVALPIVLLSYLLFRRGRGAAT